MESDIKICGVLVEPRKLSNIDYLIDNFFDVMGETDLLFFCGKSCYDDLQIKYKNNKYIKLVTLKVDNLNAKEHNDLWKSINFWDFFKNYSHILTIQTDGCLCKNSKFKIEDFLHYDFIGGYTPNKWWWKETHGLHKYSDNQCFNGGFSLRNVKASLNLIKHCPPLPTEDFSEKLPFASYGEDLYFVVGFLKMNQLGISNYNVALDEFATNFCTHTHYLKNTFCVHKLDNYTDYITILKFFEYCPEFEHFIKQN